MEKKVDPRCPGDDPARKSVPEQYLCPGCGAEVELWSDEKKTSCYKCGITVTREQARQKS